MYRFWDGTQTDQFWLDATMELLRRCDAIALHKRWRKSSGSKAEKAEAERMNLPVFDFGSPNARPQLGMWVDEGDMLERRKK
jgi:hypothetical protein